MTILILLCAAAVLILVSCCFCKTAHPLLNRAKSSVSGFAALLLVNLTSFYTGCYIAVNPRTTFVSTVLSLPGVVSLLIMKLVFNY